MHSRCNLACDYCYIYAMGDESWRARPVVMPDDVVESTAIRIAEHVRAHDLRRVRVIFHGGEPLLAGAKRLISIADIIDAALPAGTRADYVVQTNGTLLDTDTLGQLLSRDVKVGVSLDGGTEAHNRHRRNHPGRTSYHQAEAAVHQLAQPPYSKIFGGILCTIHLENDPVEVYESMLCFSPPMIDVLLPHANWNNPPPRPRSSRSPTPYADWLVALFDRWCLAPCPETRIRLFDGILAGLLGLPSRSEQVGTSPMCSLVVETDGDIEQIDVLRSAFPGACATDLSVHHHPFDAALTHPGVAIRQQGVAGLSPSCRSCELVNTCGGGHYAHRFRRERGFDNPSVYCEDLKVLIRYVRDRLAHHLGLQMR